jgi:DNA-binding transcriptional ArsR family regulator
LTNPYPSCKISFTIKSKLTGKGYLTVLPLGIDLEKTQERKLKAILDPTRLKMLYKLKEPRTVKQIADSLGVDHHALYHHMGVLEKAGLVKLDRKVQKGNLVEKYYSLVEDAMRFRLDLLPQELSSNLVENLIQTTYRDYSQAVESHDEPVKAGAMRLSIEVPKGKLKEINEKVRKLVEELRDKIIEMEQEGSDSSYAITVIHFQIDPKNA